jgi:hypothetical protein
VGEGTARAQGYARRTPENTLLYRAVAEHVETFLDRFEASRGGGLPRFVIRELRKFLACGILARGFARVHCSHCHKDSLVAFSCKGRGFCPSCGARRMAELAAHLVDAVIPEVPVRQWVLTVPFPVRSLLAYDPSILAAVRRIFARAILSHLARPARRDHLPRPQSGAICFVQRFDSGLRLNVHFHMLALDGVYLAGLYGPEFEEAPRPSPADIARLTAKIAHRVCRLLRRLGRLPDPDAPADDHPGSTHVVFDPLSFLERLAALVPRPRLPLVTYHGILAPHARRRADIVPQPPPPSCPAAAPQKPRSGRRRRYYSWAELMLRVFRHELLVCPRCHGPRKVLTFLTDPLVIRKILLCLGLPAEAPAIAPARAPPQPDLAY